MKRLSGVDEEKCYLYLFFAYYLQIFDEQKTDRVTWLKAKTEIKNKNSKYIVEQPKNQFVFF